MIKSFILRFYIFREVNLVRLSFFSPELPFSMLRQVVVLSLIFLVSACLVDDKKSKNLPRSLGSNHEIIVIVDSVVWKSAVGKTLRNIFSQTLVTPQAEPLFQLLNIQPDKFNHVLKRHHSLVFMTTLNYKNKANRALRKWFSPENIKAIESDSQYIFPRYNLYARPQIGLFLAAKNIKTLDRYLLNHGKDLQIIFSQRELKRLQSGLYGSQDQNILAQKLKEQHNYTVKIPNGYELVKSEKKSKRGFTWLRQSEAEYDKHLILAYKPYTNTEETTQAAILAWRNTLGQKHLFGDPDNPESFVVTETLEPPTFQNLNFRKQYAILIRGLWRTNNRGAGGPFVSYFIIDQNQGRLYYLEGFIRAPGLKKRNFLREVEAILMSFEP